MIDIGKIFLKNKGRIIFIVFFLVNLLILSFSNYKDGGDDLFYKNAVLNYQVWEFVSSRYMNWTGRILPEFLAYFFDSSLVVIWPIVNAAVITLLSVLIFKYINIFKEVKPNKKTVFALIICLSFLLIEKSTISMAFIWRTGSINYLWPVTLGFLAFYPFLKSFKNKLNKRYYVFYFVISFLATISMEQISVALFIGVTTYFGYMINNKKKIPAIIYLMSLNILIGSLILFLAPGNKVRLEQEAAHNFPDFLNLGIFNRISISLYWILNKLINVLPLILAPIYIFLGWKNNNTPKIISKIAIALGITLIIKSIFGIEYKVYPITSDNIFSIQILLNYFILTIGLLLIPYLIWKNFGRSQNNLIYLLILVIVLVLMIMITLSPTLDVSGNRTLFLPSLLINILSILLLFEFI